MRKVISLMVLVAFVLGCIMPPAGFSQTLVSAGLLPEPGAILPISEAFAPAQLQGLTIDQQDPFKFDFLMRKGDLPMSDEEKMVAYKDIIKFFLASLTVPDTDQWVNLSPYEGDRLINENFGMTEMGRELLAQDYLLKQLTASLIHPDTEVGKKFWSEIYRKANELYGTTDIPIDTFNKVWIIPDDAVVFEQGNTAYLMSQHLKVMTERDYVAMKQQEGQESPVQARQLEGSKAELAALSSEVMRNVVVPAIEKEINEGKTFAGLRQVCSAMILATWYKKALKETILGKVYADQGKLQGIDQDPRNNEAIYARYVEAFQKGVFNLIREDVDTYSQELIPRKYFSGGIERDHSKTSYVHDPKNIPAKDKSDFAESVAKSKFAWVKTLLSGNKGELAQPTALTTEEEEFVQKKTIERFYEIIRKINDSNIDKMKKHSSSVEHFPVIHSYEESALAKLKGKIKEALAFLALLRRLKEEGFGWKPESLRALVSVEAFTDDAPYSSVPVWFFKRQPESYGYRHSDRVRVAGLSPTFIAASLEKFSDQTVSNLVERSLTTASLYSTKEAAKKAFLESALSDTSLSLSNEKKEALLVPLMASQQINDEWRVVPSRKWFQAKFGNDLLGVLNYFNDKLKDKPDAERESGIPLLQYALSTFGWESQVSVETNNAITPIYGKSDVPITVYSIDAQKMQAMETIEALLGWLSPTERTGILTSPGTQLSEVSGHAGKFRISMQTSRPGTIVDNASNNVVDNAFVVEAPVTAAHYGGIDLNAANLNLRIKRDGSGVPLPVSMQDLEGFQIDGLTPEIISITSAVSLPGLNLNTP